MGQRVELGAFLRARRAALRPGDVGLPTTKRRHVTGLRREEVAQLAEVGLDWYAALEQGRVAEISRKSLRRVLSSLRFDSLESEHAFMLAGDGEQTGRSSAIRIDALESFVRSYTDGASFAIDGTSNAFVWNALADELFAFSSRTKDDRRMIAMMIRDARMRRLFVNWSETLERMIGVFRLTSASNESAAVDELVRDLRAESSEFDRLWREYTVGSPTTHICELRTENGGELHLQFIAFSSIDSPQSTVVALRRL